MLSDHDPPAFSAYPFGDDEILANAGLEPDPGWDGTHFDASVFVLVPEPGTLALVAIGLAALAGARRRV